MAGWLCLLVAMLEGFDLQVAGIAAPTLKPALGLEPAALGWFFSASTIGLLFGALAGGRLSDRYGRARVLAWSVAGFGLGSLLTAAAGDAGWLIAARGFTGLGLGGALPNLLALTAENAAPGRERRAVALLYCGVPVGGAAVSLAGAAVGPQWWILFVIGGIAPLALAGWIYRVLPPDSERDGQRDSLPIGDALFGDGRLLPTLLLWVSFFATLIILYLVLNWLPSFLIDLGLGAGTAFLAQLAFNIGGIVVCASVAAMLDGRRGWLVALGAFSAIPLLLLATARVDSGGSAIFLAFVLGGAVLVTQSHLYALAPGLYPEAGRGTGVGGAVAAGRFGSIAGPLLGAYLLAAGDGTGAVLRGIVPVAVIAGTAAIALSLLVSRPSKQAVRQ